MQYSAQRWPVADDIDSAIQRLASELSVLSMDALHAANYDLTVCFNEDAIKRTVEDSERYSVGANLCNKYTEGMLNLHEFCDLMNRIDLRNFLYVIEEYLPKDILEKYQLETSDSNEKEGTEVNGTSA